MTSDGTHSYTWDARNRLQQIDLGNTASFTYDPFGRRATKSIVGTSTTFLYDGANAVQEVIGGTNTANSLSGGIDEVFQRTDSAGARSFLADPLGSTLALTDSTGTVQTSYSFEPFGNTTLSGSATTDSFAYTGRELDASNLYYYRARYYSPTLQRFISEDPIGYGGGDANLYSYASNSPTNDVDPTGTCVAAAAVVCVGAAAGGGTSVIAATCVGALILLDVGLAAYDADQAAKLIQAYYWTYAPAIAQAIKNVDVGGDDPAFASPEATAAMIAELVRRLADETLSQREREAIRRRLNELRRRLSKRKHGADKKGFFPLLAGQACTLMMGRKCDDQ